MKRKILILFSLLLLICNFAFAEDWPMFRKDVLHSAKSDELIQPPLNVKWSAEIGSAIVSSPTVSQGRVYVGARDNNLYAFNIEQGSLSWKFKTKGWVDSSVAVADNKIYFSSRDGNLYCIDAEGGGLLWSYETGGTDYASPVVLRGKVYCGSGFPNNFIYCLDAQTGELLWKTQTQQMVYSTPALFKNWVYSGSNDGHIYSLDKDTGHIQWKYSTKGGMDLASPVIKDKRIYIAPGNFNWFVYALSTATGKEIWKFDIPDKQMTPNYVSSIALGKDTLFVACGYAQQYLYCLDSAKGNMKWKARLGQASRLGFASSPCVTEDIVYVFTAQGRLKAFEIVTGRLVWEYELGDGVVASPALSDGVLYIGTLDGKLVAME